MCRDIQNLMSPVAHQCAGTNRPWLPGMACCCRHSRMAPQDEPLCHCIFADRLWHRPLSGSHAHCHDGARLDSLAPILGCLLGVAFIAAGVSFATGRKQRWATLGLGVMFALWLITVHLPPVLNYLRNPGAPQDPDKWSDVFIVAALWGGFWALARGLRDKRLPSPA